MFMDGIVMSDDVYQLAESGANIRLIELAYPHAADVDHIERTVGDDGLVQLWTVYAAGSSNARMNSKVALNAPVKPGHVLRIHEPWRATNESSVVCGARAVRIELKQSGAFVSVNPLGEDGFATYWRAYTDAEGWHSAFQMPRSAAQRSLFVRRVKAIALHELRADDLENAACVLPISNRAILVRSNQSNLRAAWEMGMSYNNAKLYGWDANPYIWVIDTEPRVVEEL